MRLAHNCMGVTERFLETLDRLIPGVQYVQGKGHLDYDKAITILARHREVGDMIIEVEDDDIRVHIGHITHCHINWNPDDGVNEEIGQSAMIQEAIEFLKNVLNDKVVFWKGWWMDGSFHFDRLATIKRKKRIRYYLWSGPL